MCMDWGGVDVWPVAVKGSPFPPFSCLFQPLFPVHATLAAIKLHTYAIFSPHSPQRSKNYGSEEQSLEFTDAERKLLNKLQQNVETIRAVMSPDAPPYS